MALLRVTSPSLCSNFSESLWRGAQITFPFLSGSALDDVSKADDRAQRKAGPEELAFDG